MTVAPRLQIRQYNDWEILEIVNAHEVENRLVGDHRFTIRSHGTNVAAGPGDWLSVATDGEVEVERGDDARGTQQAITGDGNLSRAERVDPAVL